MWQMLTEDRKEQLILPVQMGDGRFWRPRYHQCWYRYLNVALSISRTVRFSYYDINLYHSIPLTSVLVLENAKFSIQLRNALIVHLGNIFGAV